MGQEAEVFARHGIGPLDEWTPLEAPARRRRWYDDGNGHDGRAARVGVGPRRPRPDARRLPDRVEQAAPAAARRATGRRRARRPTPAECAAVLGGTEDDWVQLAEAWGEAFADAARATWPTERLNLRVRMLGGSSVGYARMTRRWWAPVRADAGRARARGPADVLRLLEPALDGRTCSRARRAGARTRSPTGSSATGRTTCAPSSPRSATGRTDGSWENFLYFSARDFFEAQPADAARSAAPRRSARSASRTSRRAPRCASRAQVIALDSLDPRWLDPRLGDVDAEQARALPGGDRQHRVSARPRRLQHPARDHRGARHAARRLRPRQGGDAQRRRRRRDDLVGHPRRALGLDLLARQRVLRRRHRAVPDVRLGARQPARGHGQVDLPAEPRVPRLLLPRGVHGGRDGGRPVLQRGLRDRRRRPLPGRGGGQLLQAPDRLRDHPLRLRHAVHAGAHARRARAELLRDGLDLRVVAGDPAADPRARGRARRGRRR